MELTFHGVTSAELWDLMIAIKIRIKRLEGMIESIVFTDEEKLEFLRELDIQRNWENRAMFGYLQAEREERLKTID